MTFYHRENVDEKNCNNNIKYKFYKNTMEREICKERTISCDYESIYDFLKYKTIPKNIIKMINEQSLVMFNYLSKNFEEDKINQLNDEHKESIEQLKKLTDELNSNVSLLTKLKQDNDNDNMMNKTYDAIKTYNENMKNIIQKIEDYKNKINLQNEKIKNYEKKINQNEKIKSYMNLLDLIIKKSSCVIDDKNVQIQKKTLNFHENFYKIF